MPSFCSFIDREQGVQLGAYWTKKEGPAAHMGHPSNPGGEVRVYFIENGQDDMEEDKFYNSEEMKVMGY